MREGDEAGHGEREGARERVARRETRSPVGGHTLSRAASTSASACAGAGIGIGRDEHHVDARLVPVPRVQEDLRARHNASLFEYANIVV